MLRSIARLNLPRVLAASVASLVLSVATAAPQAGPVIGVIDALRYDGDQYYVFGWACQQGVRNSIGVHIYASGAAGGKPPGTFVTPGTADLPNEPAVDHECHDADGGKHRFKVALPNQLLRSFQNKKMYIHGIAIAGNLENSLLAG